MAQSANVEMPASYRTNLSLTALAGWLLVLPATFFLAAAALRTLQPRQFQPARACWAIFEWVATHFTHLDAAVVFLALPSSLWRPVALRSGVSGAGTRLCAGMRQPLSPLFGASLAPFAWWPRCSRPEAFSVCCRPSDGGLRP